MSNIAIRVKQALLSVFIERQLYIRARGSVSYVPLSSRSQIALSALFLAFAAWFSFATVNVIFKDEISERKDREFLEMQLAYENELRRLQLAYDDLNSQIVLTRDWFSETTNSLEKKHHELTRVLEQNASISSELRQMQIVIFRPGRCGLAIHIFDEIGSAAMPLAIGSQCLEDRFDLFPPDHEILAEYGGQVLLRA